LAERRRPCPEDHWRQCWDTEGETFEATSEVLDAIEGDLERWEQQGCRIGGATVVVTCTQRLNEALALGQSRFDVDLHSMERLAWRMREQVGQDLSVTCGKVGGIDRYGHRFRALSHLRHEALEEGRSRSAYRLEGLGEMVFLRDAEDAHMLVGIASIIGKWVRDMLMTRIVRYHRRDDTTLPMASGYHDPVTARFVEATALSRKARHLPDTCFERTRSGSTAS
jgi:hypothetical protein